MIFSLEALKAGRGDCLLIHFGDPEDPSLALVDGGPAGTYRNSLRPRLRTIGEERGHVRARLAMVSHIDADHVMGLLDLLNDLRDNRAAGEIPLGIDTLWLNTWDELIADELDTLVMSVSREVGLESLDASLATDVPSAGLTSRTGAVIGSVPTARRLRENVELLGIPLNQPFASLVWASPDGDWIQLGDGLEIRVVAPTLEWIEDHRRAWQRTLETQREDVEAGWAGVASFADASVAEVASLVTLLRLGGKQMLLTGDARGDHILQGLAAAGLLDPDGRLHVDLLKIPDQGSDRNVSPEFFQRIRADHYLISADGSHSNPELATFEMLLESRREDDRPFRIVLTYPPQEYRSFRGQSYPVRALESLLTEARRDGRQVELVTPHEDQNFVRIDLLAPYEGP